MKPWHVFVAGMLGMLVGGGIVYSWVHADWRAQRITMEATVEGAEHRAAEARDRMRELEAKIDAIPGAKVWYCHFLDHTDGDRKVFIHTTTCTRDVADCERSAPCFTAPRAWCGTNTCTHNEHWCREISGNAPCHIREP